MARAPTRKSAPTDAPAITETPEFKAAVETAVEAATKKILAMLSGRTESAAAEPSAAAPAAAPAPEFLAFANALAMSISDLGGQGVGKIKKVAPEVMAERTAAHGRMVELIVDAYKAADAARRAGDQEAADAATPLYALRDKVYFGERIVNPIYVEPFTGRKRQQEIEWFRSPNHSMTPVNDIAKAIHAEFMQWTGTKIATPLDDLRDLAITASGFVVRGGSASLQRNANLRDVEAQHTGAANQQALGALKLRGRAGAGATEVHVLGTLHQPALESA